MTSMTTRFSIAALAMAAVVGAHAQSSGEAPYFEQGQVAVVASQADTLSSSVVRQQAREAVAQHRFVDDATIGFDQQASSTANRSAVREAGADALAHGKLPSGSKSAGE